MSSAATGRIFHPGTGETVNQSSFAAFGKATGVSTVRGEMVGQSSGTRFPQASALVQPGPEFWVLYFRITPVQDELYTFNLYDDSDGNLLDATTDIALASSPPPPATGPLITYPHSADNPICLSFAAYGTSSNVGNPVSGTISPATSTSITQVQPPPNWVLQCSVTGPGSSCTLTVSQSSPSASDSSSGLQFQTC